VDGDIDPVRDMETIFEELRLKDAEYLIKTLDNLERTVVRGNDKSRRAEYVSFVQCMPCLVFIYFLC
jgi:obg-like ATPase 1